MHGVSNIIFTRVKIREKKEKYTYAFMVCTGTGPLALHLPLPLPLLLRLPLPLPLPLPYYYALFSIRCLVHSRGLPELLPRGRLHDARGCGGKCSCCSSGLHECGGVEHSGPPPPRPAPPPPPLGATP